MAERTIFDTLKKLFSSDVVIRNVGGDQLKVVDTNNIQSSGKYQTNSLVDRFTRLYIYNNKNIFNPNLNYQSLRIQLYSDYEAMDTDPIIASALDIIADEACVKSEFGEVLSIKSSDENIQRVLYNLFYDILNIEFNLWSWTRNMAKYGDFFLKLEIAEELGVYNVIPYTVYHISRHEGMDPENPTQVIFRLNPDGIAVSADVNYKPNPSRSVIDFDNYEVAHFRLLSDTNFLPYGKSYIESARKLYKQLCLTGDTRVWTPNGYTFIKDINPGDTIYSFDYDKEKLIETKVLHRTLTGVKPVYEIKTGHRVLKATAEHPIMISDGSYKRVDELTLGDYLLPVSITDEELGKVPSFELPEEELVSILSEKGIDQFREKRQVCLECGKVIKNNNHNHLKLHSISLKDYYRKYDIPKKEVNSFSQGHTVPLSRAKHFCSVYDVSEDLLDVRVNYRGTLLDSSLLDKHKLDIVRFFGFMLGDGWIDKSTGTVSFSLGTNLEKSMKYVTLLEDLKAPFKVVNEGTSKAQVNCYSAHLRKILEHLGFITGTFNKVVPGWVYTLPLNYKKEFLYGFVDADGSYQSSTRMSLSGANRDMIYDLQTLAQQADFEVSNMSVMKGGSIGDWGTVKKDQFTFTINSGDYHSIKVGKTLKAEKIRKIELLESEEVYDLGVDNQLHNFVANGLPVHNCLLEDAALIHRIMRSPEKRTFFINVGSIPPAEVDQFMQKTINNMKKTPYVGADGQYNLKFNMQNMMEDFYIPVRGNDATTRIETSKGLDYDGMADISYFQAKLFAALKIPKAFFGFEGELSGKATLSAESVRFARTIERIQRILESELTKIALVHLAAQGFKGESLANFDIKLTTPSIVFEQEKVALLKEKVDLAVQMKDSELFASDYIYEKIFDLSEDTYNEMRELVVEDKKQAFRLAQIENEGNDPAKSGRSYGTPHDLASMYGRRSDASTRGGNLGEVPPGYEDDPNPPILPQNKKDTKLGRPVEKKSIYGTNAYPVGGRDPLGKHPGYPSDNENVSETSRTKTLLAKHFGITDAKELFFKKTSKSTPNLLNESNIKDLED